MPCSVLLTIASSDDSTIAASTACAWAFIRLGGYASAMESVDLTIGVGGRASGEWWPNPARQRLRGMIGRGGDGWEGAIHRGWRPARSIRFHGAGRLAAVIATFRENVC